MRRFRFISFLFTTLGLMNIQSQSIEISAENLILESSNSLVFDAYIKNAGDSSWRYCDGQYLWSYDTLMLNGGVGTFTIVSETSELPAGYQPSGASLRGSNLRVSTNFPGSQGPILDPGSRLRLDRFRLQTSTTFPLTVLPSIIFKKDVTPYTRAYYWNGKSIVEFIEPNKTYVELPNKLLK